SRHSAVSRQAPSITVPAIPRRCAISVRMSPHTVAFSRPPLSITTTEPGVTSSMNSPTVPAGFPTGPYSIVNARPVRRKRESRGLMFRHCPATPSRSSASLIVAVSSLLARSTDESCFGEELLGKEYSLIAQHVLVVRAHHFGNGFALVKRLGHGRFSSGYFFRRLQNSFDVFRGDENHAASIRNRVVPGLHFHIANLDRLIIRQLHDASPRGHRRHAAPEYRKVVLARFVDSSYRPFRNHTAKPPQLRPKRQNPAPSRRMHSASLLHHDNVPRLRGHNRCRAVVPHHSRRQRAHAQFHRQHTARNPPRRAQLRQSNHNPGQFQFVERVGNRT